MKPIPVDDLYCLIAGPVWADGCSSVAIDDGGLTIVEIDKRGRQTGAYLEIGGIPQKPKRKKKGDQ